MLAIGSQPRKNLAHCDLKLRPANVKLQLGKKAQRPKRRCAFFIELQEFKAMAN